MACCTIIRCASPMRSPADPRRISTGRFACWRGAVLKPTGAPMQTRTWNLSALWRIPLEGTAAWLKVIPPFMAPEGALLQRLAGPAIPRLLGSERNRCLIAEVPGEDLYDAPFPVLKDMVTVLVTLQQQSRRRSTHCWHSVCPTIARLR